MSQPSERDTHQSHAPKSRPHRWENELVTNPDNETYFTPSSRLVSFPDTGLSSRESPGNNRPQLPPFLFLNPSGIQSLSEPPLPTPQKPPSRTEKTDQPNIFDNEKNSHEHIASREQGFSAALLPSIRKECKKATFRGKIFPDAGLLRVFSCKMKDEF